MAGLNRRAIVRAVIGKMTRIGCCPDEIEAFVDKVEECEMLPDSVFEREVKQVYYDLVPA